MPRPLSPAERQRLEDEAHKIREADERGRQLKREAIAHRDRAIAEIVAAGGSQVACAEVLGLTRQAIHDALKRASGDS